MSRRLPSTHADTHRPIGTLGSTDPGGSDPLPLEWVGIRYDFDNVGDWLRVRTTGAAPSSQGILLKSEGDGNDIVLESDGGIYINDLLGWSIVLQSTTGTGGAADIDVLADRDVVLTAGRDVDVQAASFLNLASLDTADLGASTELQLSSDHILVTVGSAGIEIASTGGIYFHDNSGDGIYINEESGGSGGIAIEDSGSGGLLLESSGDGDLRVNNLGTGQMVLFDASGNDLQVTADTTAAGSIALSARGTDAELRTTSYHAHLKSEDNTGGLVHMWLEAGNGGYMLQSASHIVAIVDDYQIRVSTGNIFQVMDQAVTARFIVADDGKIRMPSLPTSSAGLPSGSLWNSAGVVHIV